MNPSGAPFWTDLLRYRSFAVYEYSCMTGALHIHPKGHLQNPGLIIHQSGIKNAANGANGSRINMLSGHENVYTRKGGLIKLYYIITALQGLVQMVP